MSSRQICAVLLSLAAALAAGCGSGENEGGSAEPELSVTATTTHLGDFVRQVGGDRVDVQQILGPNADPHGYDPRPSDVQALAHADLVLQSGGDLDEFLGDLIENSGSEAPIVEAIDSVETIEGGGDGHEEEGEHAEEEDPHWWQDPRNVVRVVTATRDALIEADPDGRQTYERNAAAYIDELRRLDSAVARCIERIPAGDRNLVTTHDALGYYADRYGLKVIGALIPSLSTQAQPSSGDTQDLVEQIERLEVKAIFPESALNPKLEDAVARETGAEVGEALWADTLGPEGSSGATYVESIEANTVAIVEGLTGGEVSCRALGP